MNTTPHDALRLIQTMLRANGVGHVSTRSVPRESLLTLRETRLVEVRSAHGYGQARVFLTAWGELALRGPVGQA